MIKTDICVIGAGPGGLTAAIEAKKCGAEVVLIDENQQAGGQLFKQIHKFFGSKEHQAGVRGMDIGNALLKEARELGVEIRLRTVAYGIFEDGIIGIHHIDEEKLGLISAKKTIIATGAVENALPFEGWTKPGVMGAGAAQTLIHLYRLKPGNKIVMVGSGNVGLIVSYQLMQAGVEVVALVEAAPKITGYMVHARKLLRAGVPIYTQTTVKEVKGEDGVEKAVLRSTAQETQDESNHDMPLELDVDTVCIAVGLSPLAELAHLADCEFTFNKNLGGFVPVHDKNMKTSQSDVYVAGDVAGIEEASSAMEEGRIAGISACESLNLVSGEELKNYKEACFTRLAGLRQAPTPGQKLAGLRQNPTADGLQQNPTSEQGLADLQQNPIPDFTKMPGYPSQDRILKGPVAIIECEQEIPCNPCESSCPNRAIEIGSPITKLPVLTEDSCTGCGVCVYECPGQAIFILDKTYSEKTALVGFPYEYFPLPSEGEQVKVVNRNGEIIGDGIVKKILHPTFANKTYAIYVEVDKKIGEEVRSIVRK